ncbi:MAG: conjugal transfer protein TraF [Gammaproteobacteria bacterium]|nr:conjugal transfer protein TraF [Gammaproteobacteria bacterium]
MGSHFKVLARISCLSLVFLFCALQGVEGSFYEDKARGWFWYEDPFLEEEDNVRTIKKENLLPESLPVEPNYGEQLQRYKKSLEDKKAKALMSPTYSHVKDYMIAQKDMSDRASFGSIGFPVV